MLNAHLEEVDRSADEMFSQLVKLLTVQEGITEYLKANDQRAWVGRMNNIQERVSEIIMQELIYN